MHTRSFNNCICACLSSPKPEPPYPSLVNRDPGHAQQTAISEISLQPSVLDNPLLSITNHEPRIFNPQLLLPGLYRQLGNA
jgi:hypothetical protein